MSNVKVFKKGEFLIKEGERAQNVLLIQSGAVNVFLTKSKQNIELYQLSNTQVVGEHALYGIMVHPHSVQATTEVKALEVPLDGLKATLEGSTQLVKLLVKSLSDKVKVLSNDLRSVKLERDNTPCPHDQTAKIFGAVYHTARHKGKEKDGKITVEWPSYKQYAQRVFIESPKRLEQAVSVFVKLKLAQFEMVKSEEDPEAPEELGFVHFFDLIAIEQFFEFWQYYYFKGGKMELLKYDDMSAKLVTALLKIAENEKVDRFGAVRLDYPKLVERYKEVTGLNLNADHFARLETKGLFVKRSSTDDGVYLSFDLKEFQRTLMNWRILREVEKWNEKGFVDLNEEDEAKKKKAGQNTCPSCNAPCTEGQKFCGECGHKLAAAA